MSSQLLDTAVQILAAPGSAAGCCALDILALPCQGCEWYLSTVSRNGTLEELGFCCYLCPSGDFN